MNIFRVFTIEAAHRLPNVPAGTSARACTAIRFASSCTLSGAVDPHTGWVMDFADVRAAFQPIYDRLDHHYLNEIAGPRESHQRESGALGLAARPSRVLPLLSKVVIHETCTSGCDVRRRSS